MATSGRRPLARLPATRLALVGAAEERERRPEQDLQVERGRAVLDVVDVELDPIVPRELGAASDLGQARDPRLHLEATTLEVRVALDLVTERRPRPDDRHVATYDVPELR